MLSDDINCKIYVVTCRWFQARSRIFVCYTFFPELSAQITRFTLVAYPELSRNCAFIIIYFVIIYLFFFSETLWETLSGLPLV